jgi:hypothetical protein
MLWPLRIAFRLIRLLSLIAISVSVGMAIAFVVQIRQLQRSWGVVSADVDRPLPGDDVIAAPDVHETRTLVIDAAPSVVWPWLAQLGWGRGGWYSYDRIDMDSASSDTILEEFQDLAVGDIVPTHPGGGFVAKVVEPEKALVLYLDTELVNEQLTTEETDEAEAESGQPAEDLPAGLGIAGAMGDMTMPDFRGTWAFVLEPAGEGRTRLIERFRLWTGEAGLPQKLGMPFMSMGVFAMTRKHMLGVQERAEALARDGAVTPKVAIKVEKAPEAEPVEV